MISVLIYRLFFRGRHRGLYVLTMTAYYSLCFLMFSGPLTMPSDEDLEDGGRPPPSPVVEVPLSEVTTDSLRLRNVTDRWALRARVLERYCGGLDAANRHRTGDGGVLTSERYKLTSCAGGDTADHFWLRTFTRLAQWNPSHRCGERHHDLYRCRDEARSLGALTEGDADPVPDARWTWVVTVRHPFSRLVAAFLREPFPTPSSSFAEAVSALTSGTISLPEHAEPLTSTCDLCSGLSGRPVILQHETEDEELAELGHQQGISEYLRRPVPSPRSPARAAASGPDPTAISRLIGQLTAEQFHQLRRLYRNDFDALAFYDPAEFGRGRGSSEVVHQEV